MKKSSAILLIIFIPFLSMQCGSPNIVSTSPEVLRKYRTVAVPPVEISIDTKDSSTLRIVSSISSYREHPYMKNLVGDPDLGFLISKDPKKLDNFQDFIIEVINKNLLNKGFQPIERSRIKALLKEIGLQHSGLIDPEKATRIGELARADSIFMGKIMVQVEREIMHARVTVFFSGRLVSVREGIILISGQKSTQKKDLMMNDIKLLVDRWFSEIKQTQ